MDHAGRFIEEYSIEWRPSFFLDEKDYRSRSGEGKGAHYGELPTLEVEIMTDI